MICRTVSDEPRRILLAATRRWVFPARLAIRFANAGCHVEMICPRGHLASRITAVVRTHSYHALAPLTSFRRAIQRTEQDLVIPCDDLAATHLQDLYEEEIRSGNTCGQMAVLLERSLGAPRAIASLTQRNRLLHIAQSEGIVVPKTAPVRILAKPEDWPDTIGFPAVLKADGTSAGVGVRIVRTRLEAERAFNELSAPPVSLRVLKRAVVDRDFTLILPFILRNKPLINAQELIMGRDATTSLACWKGKVLASITFEVLRATRPNGPASVVRLLDNAQISEASARLVRRLNLSGLYGLDFKIDDLNVAYMLEMNPRATQSSHLSLGKGRDLIGGLVAAVSGHTSIEKEIATTSGSVIALFPNEWQNNPASRFLKSAYHDVPWSEPELVRECVKKPSWLEKWCSPDKWAVHPEIGLSDSSDRGSVPFDYRNSVPAIHSRDLKSQERTNEAS